MNGAGVEEVNQASQKEPIPQYTHKHVGPEELQVLHLCRNFALHEHWNSDNEVLPEAYFLPGTLVQESRESKIRDFGGLTAAQTGIDEEVSAGWVLKQTIIKDKGLICVFERITVKLTAPLAKTEEGETDVPSQER